MGGVGSGETGPGGGAGDGVLTPSSPKLKKTAARVATPPSSETERLGVDGLLAQMNPNSGVAKFLKQKREGLRAEAMHRASGMRTALVTAATVGKSKAKGRGQAVDVAQVQSHAATTSTTMKRGTNIKRGKRSGGRGL